MGQTEQIQYRLTAIIAKWRYAIVYFLPPREQQSFHGFRHSMRVNYTGRHTKYFSSATSSVPLAVGSEARVSKKTAKQSNKREINGKLKWVSSTHRAPPVRESYLFEAISEREEKRQTELYGCALFI